MSGACNSKFFGPAPWGAGEGSKEVKYHLISITKSISKIFIPNFVCVLTNERYKTYQSQCQNSSKFLSVSYLMKTADVIMIFFSSHNTTDHT